MTQETKAPNTPTSTKPHDIPERQSFVTLVRWARRHHRRVRIFMRDALGQEIPPRRLALSFAVGVFCSMLPFPGHTIVVVGCAMVFRLNVMAGIAGAWVNLPPIMPFSYGLAFLVGALVTHQPLPRIATERFGEIGYWWELMSTYFYPMVVGTTIVGAAMAIPGYSVAHYVIRRMRKAQDSSESVADTTRTQMDTEAADER